MPNVPRTQLLVFWLLRYWVLDLDGRVSASNRYIARVLGISRDSAKRAIQGLRAAGALAILYNHVVRLNLDTLSSWITLGTYGRIPGSALNDPRLTPLAKTTLGLLHQRPNTIIPLKKIAASIHASQKATQKSLLTLISRSYTHREKTRTWPYKPRYTRGPLAIEEFSFPSKPVRATSGLDGRISTPTPGEKGGVQSEPPVQGVRKEDTVRTRVPNVPAHPHVTSPPEETWVSHKKRRIKPRKIGDILNDMNLP